MLHQLDEFARAIVSKPKPPTKRGPGRPPLGDKVATELVKLRITAEVRRRWEQQADRDGVSLSEWIRQRCAS